MPRRKEATDEAILDAAARIAADVGPYRLTLADVAAEVGLTAGALSQRFGSKRDLLLAMVDAGAVELRAHFDGARAAAPSPLGALVAALSAAPGDPTARQVAASLAFLQLDMTDDAFRRSALAFFDAFHGRVVALLQEALAARELRREADVEALARALEVAFHGARIRWALRGEGKMGAAVQADVEAVLEPWKARRLLRG